METVQEGVALESPIHRAEDKGLCNDIEGHGSTPGPEGIDETPEKTDRRHYETLCLRLCQSELWRIHRS